MIAQILSRSLQIHEQGIDSADIGDLHFLGFALLGHQRSGGNQLDCVTQGRGLANLGQEFQGLFGHLHVFLLAACLENLANLLRVVVLGGDDQQPIQQIQWHSVRSFVVRAADVGNSSVGGQNQNWGRLAFQCSV